MTRDTALCGPESPILLGWQRALADECTEERDPIRYYRRQVFEALARGTDCAMLGGQSRFEHDA